MSTNIQCDVGGNVFGNNIDEVKHILNSKDKYNENQFLNAEGDVMNLNINNNIIMNIGNAVEDNDVVNKKSCEMLFNSLLNPF